MTTEKTGSGWGKILREMRREKNWTREELALRANISTGSVARLEKDYVAKTAFEKVVEALGYEVDICSMEDDYEGLKSKAAAKYANGS